MRMMLVTLNLKPSGNGVVMSMDHECTVNFSGRNLTGDVTHQESFRCASRGTIENQFWATLQAVSQARAQKTQ